jgi:C4-dicarboxylate-specific signal transduction histidine kinase
MSAVAAIVIAALLIMGVLIGAIVMQRRRIRRQHEAAAERQRLAHLARVAIVGELSGGLAHELNQPLTSILSNAQAAQQALARDCVDLAEVREMLADIVAEDKRAGELIGSIRKLLKRQDAVKQAIDPAALLKEAQGLMRSSLTSRQVTLTATLEPDLPQVLGDGIQLQQVLLNLLLNACDAVKECGRADRRIELDARAEAGGQTLHVTVADHGTGIAGDDLERVFDAFFTTKPSGLGLGLAICRQIVSAHGGRLWAAHNGGRGAVFHLTLPAAANAVRNRERATG